MQICARRARGVIEMNCVLLLLCVCKRKTHAEFSGIELILHSRRGGKCARIWDASSALSNRQ